MPADSPHLRLSPGSFAQLCATIVIAIILVLTGCMPIPAVRVGEPASKAPPTSTPGSRPSLRADLRRGAQGTAQITQNERGRITAATPVRHALAKRCSWVGNWREGTPQHAAYGRSRPRARRTTCRSNLPVETARQGTQRLA